jgi:glycosyltransferase involved in cell wall biosynthesis
LRPWWKSALARILRPFLKAVDLFLSRECDRVIANSRYTAAELERVYGKKAACIAYPGIDFSAYSGGIGPKEQSVITVARLTGFKRIDFLLEVFARLLKYHPDLTYHIVGTGEEEAALRKQAQLLGLKSQVIFHGTVDDRTLAGLYRRSCIYLSGSIDEPFGMAPLEAIAWGTPVVAHMSGGPLEFVTPDCGRLIDSRDVEEWAGEIADYLAVLSTLKDSPDRVRECARRFDWRASLRPAVEVSAGLSEEPGATTGQPTARRPVPER